MPGASHRVGELRVVRHPGAVAIVGDAVLAAWCGEELPYAERQVLNSPFVRAVSRLPGAAARATYDGPRPDLLGSLAAVLRRADRKLWRRLGLGADGAAPGTWSRLMHEAARRRSPPAGCGRRPRPNWSPWWRCIAPGRVRPRSTWAGTR